MRTKGHLTLDYLCIFKQLQKLLFKKIRLEHSKLRSIIVKNILTVVTGVNLFFLLSLTGNFLLFAFVSALLLTRLLDTVFI